MVGYGDGSAETGAGKIVAAMTAWFGIAVIAIPIGIVASGFNDSVRGEKTNLDSANR